MVFGVSVAQCMLHSCELAASGIAYLMKAL